MSTLDIAQAVPAADDQIEKQLPSTLSVIEIHDAEGFPEKPAPADEAQQGVRSVEAVTLTWTKKSLALAFLWFVTLLVRESNANI